MQLRAAGKSVIASMGDVAASGGYLIALAADTIVAQPGTVTGSIGVISGKFDVSQVSKRLLLGWFWCITQARHYIVCLWWWWRWQEGGHCNVIEHVHLSSVSFATSIPC